MQKLLLLQTILNMVVTQEHTTKQVSIGHKQLHTLAEQGPQKLHLEIG